MNIRLLHLLRAAGGMFVPWAALAPDPDPLTRDLDELEAFGFAIERHPYYGVAYRGPARKLCPDQIEWELGTARIGRRVAVWNRVGSTNDIAARAAGSAANAGLVVLAEEQTAGRGRRGRSWSAPPASSLLMSVLLFPPPELDDPAWLTALGAVAVAEVVEAWARCAARIKWPNDVRVAGRKVAGILVERGPGAVLGIGLNGNVAAEEFPDELRPTATSLGILAGRAIDRSELARDLIRRLDARYGEGLAGGADALGRSWRGRFEALGRRVVVETTSGPVAGLLADADLRRGLTVAAADGRTRRIPGPEVLGLRPAPGAGAAPLEPGGAGW
ncbi:MAG TPA: biotin--[acetyl-CoA-carboxylase] ligase [Isosphaeraceae bacterium]